MKNIQTGIWLDFKDAYVITFNQEGIPATIHIHSEVKHPHAKGGSHPKSPWGPQYAPPDSGNLEREKHADHHYFEQILEAIPNDTDDLVIFGPAQAKLGLKKEMENKKTFKTKLRAICPSDYMTKNEMVVLMRNFFLNPAAYIPSEEVL